ncbi:MAG: epimerase [Chitinophagaceae bacterium]|nr:MAG: epimerase [Chitinophagaceae bacterium]
MKVILTGATGMVGEGVLMECLRNPDISEVLVVGRKSVQRHHLKIKELIVPDFNMIIDYAEQLKGYDATLFCAGISSVGLNEMQYTRITYDLTIAFAETVLSVNPESSFCFVSGTGTDSSEKGKLMWARVKGKTENALMAMPFSQVYCFRPGFMQPTPGQHNVKTYYKVIGKTYPFFKLIFPSYISTMREVGAAMIKAALVGYEKKILEVKDILKAAKR